MGSPGKALPALPPTRLFPARHLLHHEQLVLPLAGLRRGGGLRQRHRRRLRRRDVALHRGRRDDGVRLGNLQGGSRAMGGGGWADFLNWYRFNIKYVQG